MLWSLSSFCIEFCPGSESPTGAVVWTYVDRSTSAPVQLDTTGAEHYIPKAVEEDSGRYSIYAAASARRRFVTTIFANLAIFSFILYL